jgi:hypothetical protein
MLDVKYEIKSHLPDSITVIEAKGYVDKYIGLFKDTYFIDGKEKQTAFIVAIENKDSESIKRSTNLAYKLALKKHADYLSKYSENIAA